MEAGILSGPRIALEVRSGFIEIDPFDPKCINPASYDLHLGDEVCVYSPFESKDRRDDTPVSTLFAGPHLLSARCEQRVMYAKMDRQAGFELQANQLYLMHTVERIHTKHYVPVLDGKSSIGRLGAMVHVTAGYGDPGFNGQYTLEVVAFNRVVLYPGMRICQIRFHTLVGERLDYEQTGNYRGEAARGPVPSKVHMQFVASSDGESSSQVTGFENAMGDGQTSARGPGALHPPGSKPGRS